MFVQSFFASCCTLEPLDTTTQLLKEALLQAGIYSMAPGTCNNSLSVVSGERKLFTSKIWTCPRFLVTQLHTSVILTENIYFVKL